MSNSDEHLRYPVGRFTPKESAYTLEEIRQSIERIEAIPAKLEAAAKALTATQLDTPYREGGWTARQVIHHVADSHMNAYIRLKWTLTEQEPTIKAYDEKAWAETAETKDDPSISIALIKALHIKWVALLKQVQPDLWTKSFLHPETGKHISLGRQVATYAWHGEHHLAHINIVLGK